MFIHWLFQVASHLKSINTTSHRESGRKMYSVLVILCLLKRMIPEHCRLEALPLEELCSVFDMLCLAPHRVGSQWKSENLDVLLSSIPETAYGELATCLETFTNLVIERCRLRRLQWLYVLPLIHIFQKKIKPFENPATKFGDIQWVDHKIYLHRVRYGSSSSDDTRYCVIIGNRNIQYPSWILVLLWHYGQRVCSANWGTIVEYMCLDYLEVTVALSEAL